MNFYVENLVHSTEMKTAKLYKVIARMKENLNEILQYKSS